MAGIGRSKIFHGAFKSKRKAVSKERETGGFIDLLPVPGHPPYVVMTDKPKRKKR